MGLLRDFWEADEKIENDEKILGEYGTIFEPSKYVKELEGLFNYPKKHRVFNREKNKIDKTKIKIKKKNKERQIQSNNFKNRDQESLGNNEIEK